jgi:hypothetical protein
MMGRKVAYVAAVGALAMTAAHASPTATFLTTTGEDATSFDRGDTVAVEVVDAAATAESVLVTILNLSNADSITVWAADSADTRYLATLVPSWGTAGTSGLDVLPGAIVACAYQGPGGSASDTARMRTHTAELHLTDTAGNQVVALGALDTMVVEVQDRDLWLLDSVVVELTTLVESESLWLPAPSTSGPFRGSIRLQWGTGTEVGTLEIQGPDVIAALFLDQQDSTGTSQVVADSIAVRTWSARALWADSLGNGVVDYAPALTESVWVRVEDRDMAGAPSVEGEVSNLSEPQELERVVLLPIGAADSTFVGVLPLLESAAAPENGVVEAAPGDTLLFSFSDEADSTGLLRTIHARVHYGGTAVAGEQWGHWESTAGPFLVYADVEVPAGQSLTVEPGVAIRAMPDQDASGGGIHPDKVELVVRGDLVVLGTASDSVVIEASSPRQTPGLWGGLRAESGSSLHMEHCRVTGAAVGVAARGAAVRLRHSAFSTNGLEGSSAPRGVAPPTPFRGTAALPGSLDANTACGIYLEDVAGDTVEACVVHATDGYGVFCTGGSPLLLECDIVRSSLDGCIWYRSGGGLEQCTVRHSGQDGLYLLESTAAVTANLFHGNGWAGVNASAGSDTLSRNGMVGNTHWGALLYLPESSLIWQNSFLGNLVGVAIHGSSDGVELRSNGICNNSEAGIRLAYGASPRLSGANLLANGWYDLEMGTYAWADVSADSIWWGPATTAAMEAGEDSIDAIWDWWDDPALGEVLFDPWRTSADGNAPREPDSTNLSGLDLIAMTGDTIGMEVTLQGSQLDHEVLDFCVVELWSTQDSMGIAVALPERNPATMALSTDGGYFFGWAFRDSLASSDPTDRLFVSGGGTVYGRVGVNSTVTDSLTWLAADPPTTVFPPAASLRFFPNPCSERGTLVLTSVAQGEHHVRLYDLLGRLTEDIQVVADAAGEGRTEWRVPARLRPGMYLWRCARGGPSCRFLLFR